MKIFISQPMNGKTDAEILMERADAFSLIKTSIPDAELIDSFFDDAIKEKHGGLIYLSESIKAMDEADSVWMLKDWEKARGCVIEHDCAVAYGIPVYYLY